MISLNHFISKYRIWEYLVTDRWIKHLVLSKCVKNKLTRTSLVDHSCNFSTNKRLMVQIFPLSLLYRSSLLLVFFIMRIGGYQLVYLFTESLSAQIICAQIVHKISLWDPPRVPYKWFELFIKCKKNSRVFAKNQLNPISICVMTWPVVSSVDKQITQIWQWSDLSSLISWLRV